MNTDPRITEIQKTLEAIQNGWPFFLAVVNQRIADMTEQLINNDNEQTRGAIKEMRRLTELPANLRQEMSSISAALADEAAAD
jgi:hypothetical protein